MTDLFAWLPWTPAATYLLAALLAACLPHHRWPLVRLATRVALCLAVISAGAALSDHGESGISAAHLVTALISFLGWIIGDYSHRYLDGEPGQTRFTLAYLLTLASVSSVVASNHFAIMVVAWSASSFALHHLLTFYQQRAAAVIVAHKKFLASRLAELCLIAAALLLYQQWHSLDLHTLGALASSSAPLPHTATLAMVLIAIAVLLKCAQLPLHGWLIQVMEAPTPVSALLHAGVVNLGGYVLIRMAPLLDAAPAAQALLVIIGGLTAVLAGLVMLTRITIKVRLAWSTCSQMGFMVMECGLGLYDLALLHLLAHSVYKAYAFLSAGDAVRDGLSRALIDSANAQQPRAGISLALLALPLSVVITVGSAYLWHQLFDLPALPWIATLLLACGLGTLLWSPKMTTAQWCAGVLAVIAATQVYLAWHWGLSTQLGVTSHASEPLLAIFVAVIFIGLYLAQVVIQSRQSAAASVALYDWVYAGFYLDERFTSLTFRIWPARIRPTLSPDTSSQP